MDSLNSEGIAFKKPRNAPSRLGRAGKRNRAASGSAEESLNLDLRILSTFEGPKETISRRLELYENYLEHLELNLQRVRAKFNDQLDANLTNFIQSSFQLIERIGSVIPIGILESCLSIGENYVIFDYIEKQLRNLSGDAQKVFVSRVQSGTSSSTKAVFQKICGQLILEESYEYEEDDEDSSPVKNGTQGTGKRAKHFSLFDVKAVLSSVKQKYKIVLIVEDVDYFANSIITQLLTLFGCANLPIVFIFGVTHGHFIQNLVPLNCSSEFVLEKFYSVSPKERFDEFMRNVLIEPKNPFKISGPIVSYLESQYKEDSFSVDHIFNSIKFCLHYHFLTGEAAFCSLEKADVYTREELKFLNDAFEGINSSGETPRKRMKVKSLTPSELLNISVDEQKTWLFFLRLLCFINLRLPDCPLGDSYSAIYVSCYGGYTGKENAEDDPFKRFFKTLSSLPKWELQRLLEESIEFLKKPKNIDGSEYATAVLEHFEEILSEVLESDATTKANTEKAEDAKSAKVMRLRKTKSLKELQESLLEAKRQKEGSSAIHAARTKLVEPFGKLLKKCLPPFSSLRCSAIFVFTDLNLLINEMYPANFLQLNEDIISPGYVLQCACCSDLDPSSIDANLPDVCIIHKLFLEHTTKKVDLNLIYQVLQNNENQFLSIVQPNITSRKSKAKTSKDVATASYLIRFRRTIGELQHMGFIKRSKSKPDEVNRLTWW